MEGTMLNWLADILQLLTDRKSLVEARRGWDDCLAGWKSANELNRRMEETNDKLLEALRLNDIRIKLARGESERLSEKPIESTAELARTKRRSRIWKVSAKRWKNKASQNRRYFQTIAYYYDLAYKDNQRLRDLMLGDVPCSQDTISGDTPDAISGDSGSGPSTGGQGCVTTVST
jgi:hypothetical protein